MILPPLINFNSTSPGEQYLIQRRPGKEEKMPFLLQKMF
jgi:hypothetical protein